MNKLIWTTVLSLVLGWTIPATATEIEFSDNFDTGASTLWGNESGDWSASGGDYSAGSPANFPATYTSLPYELSDFTFEVDVNDVVDGGVWLRSTFDGTSNVGAESPYHVYQFHG